jgi:predicted CXXCH cytochrome family protein
MKAPVRIAAILVIGATAIAQSTIRGSKHDLSPGIGGGQICIPCHTPHDAYLDQGIAPEVVLWNHQVTTQTFLMYTTSTGNTGTPDGTSLLCLSCHDGVTAMDNYGGNKSGGAVMTGSAVVGTDLSDDHPIGIEYPQGNPDFHPVPQNDLPLYNDGNIDRVECSSCHDPHGAGFGDFLRDTISGSQLCLDCHDK